MHIRPYAAYFKTTLSVLAECGHFVVTWYVKEYSCGHLVRNIPAQSCVIMWSHWPQQNEAQKQARNFYIN